PAVPASRAAPLAEPPADRAARAAVKTARRAAVRRARLAAAPLAMVCDILLVDADAGARQQLGALLDGFGFHVRPVATLAQAAVLAAHHTFAAVVVAVDPEAIDGAVHDLFEQVRCTAGRAGCAAAVRVLVAAQWRPVDRVRAELAGCEETLACPVGSRDLARVLVIHGIALPHDPRRF
ncbi:MAG: hypothetical protein Q8K45_18940, partial [Rubrivivax sp.]|nr:hypothetical protein [Rubrivivax sp.]